jgi:hypothetical protein
MRNYIKFFVTQLKVKFAGAPQPDDWVPTEELPSQDEPESQAVVDARIAYWVSNGFTATVGLQTPYYFLMDKTNLLGLLTNWQAHYQQSFATNNNWTFFEHESPRDTWSHGE